MNTKRGFTLIELLVVVLIVGILSAIALPQYEKAVFKARAVEAIQMLTSLKRAYEICVLEQGNKTECHANEVVFDMLSIDVPGTVTTDCSEDDVCFQTKNWSYENGDSDCFWAYPKEGNTVNNNLVLGSCARAGKELICADNREEDPGMKTYEGMCKVLNLEW